MPNSPRSELNLPQKYSNNVNWYQTHFVHTEQQKSFWLLWPLSSPKSEKSPK